MALSSPMTQALAAFLMVVRYIGFLECSHLLIRGI